MTAARASRIGRAPMPNITNGVAAHSISPLSRARAVVDGFILPESRPVARQGKKQQARVNAKSNPLQNEFQFWRLCGTYLYLARPPSRSRRAQQITHHQRHPDRTGGLPGGTDRLNHEVEESHDDLDTPHPWTWPIAA